MQPPLLEAPNQPRTPQRWPAGTWPRAQAPGKNAVGSPLCGLGGSRHQIQQSKKIREYSPADVPLGGSECHLSFIPNWAPSQESRKDVPSSGAGVGRWWGPPFPSRSFCLISANACISSPDTKAHGSRQSCSWPRS